MTHRALSPGSVLVRPGRHGEPPWVVLVADFSLAGGGGTGSLSRVGSRFGLPLANRHRHLTTTG